MTGACDSLLPETDPLALFIGDGPRLVVGRTGVGCDPSTIERHENGSFGSVLLLANPSMPRKGRGLVDMLAACRNAVRPGGRVAILGANRIPAAIDALRSTLYFRSSVPHPGNGSVGLRSRQVVDALQLAGWKDISVFSVAPSEVDPDVMAPLCRSPSWRTPALLVTAGCGDGPQQFLLEAMLHSLSRTCTDSSQDTSCELLRVTNSARGKSVAIAAHGNVRFVLRIARSPAMLKDEARSYEVLRRLVSNAGVSGMVPRPLAVGQQGGLHYFAQSHLHGVPLTTVLRAANRSAYLREAEAFLQALNPMPAATSPVAVDDLQGAWVGQPMVPFVLQHIADASLRARTKALLEESLGGISGRLGIVHGDFGAGNILVDRGRLAGVIDWEASHERGLPLLDAFNYLDATHRFCSRRLDITDTLPMLALGQWPLPDEMEFLQRCFDRCAVDFRFRRGVALLYLFFHIGPQLRFAATERGPIARLEGILRMMLPG